MNIGDCVQFNAEGGSKGIIEKPRGYDDGFYVRWYYGKDVKGEYMTALSSVRRNQLRLITPEELQAHRDRRGWDAPTTTPPDGPVLDPIVDTVVEAVRADLLRRSQVGIAKYGVSLDRTDLDLRDWLQHAYEECLDQANYLKRAIITIDGANK